MTKEQMLEDIHSLLEENPLLMPAVSMGQYFLNTWGDEDWKSYTEETGNEHCNNFLVPKKGLETFIDEATGYNKAQEINLLKFLLWNIKGFQEGLESGVDGI